ncbi:MAG TPA: adenylate kinase [Gammaproteobacteria bacterium]|nr:adenylate kinase [Gammaproteobacteria bacterium]
MRIVLLGVPGSGKGTQAKLMAEKYRVPQISTGDILRAAVSDKTEVGKKVAAVMAAGDLVSDDIVIDAVTDRLRAAESRRGFVLDGFPRNIPQAQELDTRLGWMGRPVQLVLHLAVEDDVVVKRVTGRLTCANCGAIFNKFFSPPAKRDVCDQCGSKKLEHRDDDNAKTVRARLASYERDTSPLISYYRAQHKLRTIPASGGTDGIFGAICEVVDTEIRPLEKKVVVLQESKTQMRPPAERAETLGGSDGEPVKSAKKKAAGASDKKKKKVEKKPVAKKTAKKKLTKKTAAKKKVAKKVAKKPTKKKANKKTTKKVTKKAASKKTVSKKKVAKTAQKKAAKKSPPAKAAKKKATKKTTKKTAKKGRVRR